MLRIKKHKFTFIKPAKTSRGEYKVKMHYVLMYNSNHITATAEIACLPDLSLDANIDFEAEVAKIKDYSLSELKEYSVKISDKLPALSFALDCIVNQADLQNSPFRNGLALPINGLVWMNTTQAMLEEAIKKVKNGYTCIKFKVGALNHTDEVELIKTFNTLFPTIQIRLDANGAYALNEAENKLKDFASFPIHSMEQPIAKGNWEAMKKLVEKNIIPIALDEELICDLETQLNAINAIKPNFLVLKPTLHGGLTRCNTLISHAQSLGIQWWATSALEGNIALQAIADWVSAYPLNIEQGLGTGLLYENNFESNMQLIPPFLSYVAS